MFSSLFNWLMGAGRELAVVLISMVPLVELRGAVPLGAVAGVPAIELIPLAVIGNMIPIPFCCSSAKSCWTGVLARPAFRLCHQVPRKAARKDRSGHPV